MDTGYPALIPEPLHHQNAMGTSTVPVNPPSTQEAPISTELASSPPTNEKSS